MTIRLKSTALPSHLITRTFGVQTKADEKSRSVRVIASTSAVDSYDEIVEQSWRLDRYRRNPVVLWQHGAGLFGSPADKLPIGFATDVSVKGGRLEATLNFVDEKASEIAERVWQGFKQGSIRAVSVGFIPSNVRTEKRDGKDVDVLSQNELFEISAVAIPANPEAIALSADQSRAQRERLLAARRGVAPRGSVIAQRAIKNAIDVLGRSPASASKTQGSKIAAAARAAADRARNTPTDDGGPKAA